MKNSDLQLEHGDAALIAKYANTTKWNVHAIITGFRGKRGSKLQDTVKLCLQIRSEQNKQLQETCKLMAAKQVKPTKK